MHDGYWTTWVMQTAKKWSDIADVIKYTGIDAIDYDHKTLTEYSLKLNQVIDKSKTDFSLSLLEETKVLLNDLYLYTREHFKREEDFIEQFSLGGRELQQSEHKRILEMLEKTIEQFNSGKTNITSQLKIQILDWLVKHINMVDYNTFKLENWSSVIAAASKWDDVKVIIRLTGIEEIDEQHQVMTSKALAAVNNIAQSPDAFTIKRMCDGLISYARYHFEYEYIFMTSYKIKNLQQHRNEHKKFTDKIKYYQSVLTTDMVKLMEMKSWIISWWINHINTVDNNDFAYDNWAYQMLDQADKAADLAKIIKKTGIKEIDHDHLELVEQTLELNSLINKTDTGKELNKEQFTAVYQEIYDFAAAHFSREEAIMKKYKMDDLKSHQEEHNGILNKLAEIKENYLTGRLFLSANFKNMILEWWINHTNTTDYKTFVEHFRQVR